MIQFFPVLINAPHSGIGGVAPIPRKLSVEIDMIIHAISSIEYTIIVGIQFGNICFNIILASEAPAEMEASIYGIVLSDSTCPLIRRA